MLIGRSIICFASITWDAQWQIPQELMSALARAGNRVLFVETTGVRRPTWRDVPRLLRRVWPNQSRVATDSPPANLRVLSPRVPPFPYSRLVLPIKTALLRRALERQRTFLGPNRPIVWTFLPTPLVRRVIPALDPELVIYHCADDFASSSPLAARIAESEVRLLESVELVIATAHGLAERAARYNAHVHLVPAGVAFDRLEQMRLSNAPPPADLNGLPKPVVGYVGGVNERVDVDLVEGVARRLPGVSFVFVGPARGQAVRLAGLPNVHLMGARSHAEMLRYMKGFDVGIIPYVVTPYTDCIYPVKLNEYLAMGLPVVSTGTREIRAFRERYPDALAIATDAGEFAEAISRAVTSSDEAERERRVEIARASAWTVRLAQISATVAARLDRVGEER